MGKQRRETKRMCLINDLHSNHIIFFHFSCTIQYKYCTLFVVKILDFVVCYHFFVLCGLLYVSVICYEPFAPSYIIHNEKI